MRILLVPPRRRVQIRVALCSAALVTAAVNVVLGWASDVPRAVVAFAFVSLLASLVNDVHQLTHGRVRDPGEATP